MTEKSNVMKQAIALLDESALIYCHSFLGDDTIVVKKEAVYELMNKLKEDKNLDFNIMMDLTVVDYLNDKDLHPYLRQLKTRYEVVYHLYSIGKNHRLRVKAPLKTDDMTIDSITPIWRGANWFEREAWDMYGVKFNNHPDLRRILLYKEFEGHPLRKDYGKTDRQPLIGPRN